MIYTIAALLIILGCPGVHLNCSAPPQLETQVYTESLIKAQNYSTGASLNTTCRLGFAPPSPQKRPGPAVCQENGSWVLPQACLKKQCENPGDLTNGDVFYAAIDKPLSFGSSVSYRCHEGYILVGQSQLFCELEGDGKSVGWSETPPICTPVLCAPPPSPQNGSISPLQDQFQYGAVVTFKCNPPTQGTVPFSLIGPQSAYCTSLGAWSVPTPQCKIVQCPYPQPPEHGSWTSGFGHRFLYGHTVGFSCEDNFVVDGSGYATCTAEGVWDPPVTLCLPRRAAPASTPRALFPAASQVTMTTKKPFNSGAPPTSPSPPLTGNSSATLPPVISNWFDKWHNIFFAWILVCIFALASLCGLCFVL